MTCLPKHHWLSLHRERSSRGPAYTSAALIISTGLLVSALGCGGRALSTGDAGPLDTDTPPGKVDTTPRPPDIAPFPRPPADPCFLAIDVGTCCPEPRPARRAEMATNPCLLPYPIPPNLDLPEECLIDCAAMCAPVGPVSHYAGKALCTGTFDDCAGSPQPNTIVCGCPDC